jgi:hypothetical protein
MHWKDRVYGDVVIDDPRIVDLIHTPTFQRLRGIRQAGPSALSFPFKVVTRFEHSIGVYVLLRRLGARPIEQVAGLLHDLSHTAFSHAVDFIIDSKEQAHHEELKPEFLYRKDIKESLDSLGFAPEAFLDDTRFLLLERPLPELCADRVDYFLRDSLSCGVSTEEQAREVLRHLVVAEGRIALDDLAVAQAFQERFRAMNEEWWASPAEAFIYNEFAEALREGMRVGALREEDLLLDDEHVLACLHAARNDSIRGRLIAIERFHDGLLRGYQPRVTPKQRTIDPAVLRGGKPIPLSRWGLTARRSALGHSA